VSDIAINPGVSLKDGSRAAMPLRFKPTMITTYVAVICYNLRVRKVWNGLSGEPPWRLAVGSRTSSLTPSLSHGASHTLDGTVCENGGSKDLAGASDWPWRASAACRHSSTPRQPSSTSSTGIYEGHPVPLFGHLAAIGRFGATRYQQADHHHAAYGARLWHGAPSNPIPPRTSPPKNDTDNHDSQSQRRQQSTSQQQDIS
jgi:hypothetical protein